MGPQVKMSHIKQLWEGAGSSFPDTRYFSDDVLRGIGSGGPAYMTGRWRELAFLIKLSLDIKQRTAEVREQIFHDYNFFLDWIADVE